MAITVNGSIAMTEHSVGWRKIVRIAVNVFLVLISFVALVGTTGMSLGMAIEANTKNHDDVLALACLLAGVMVVSIWSAIVIYYLFYFPHRVRTGK